VPNPELSSEKWELDTVEYGGKPECNCQFTWCNATNLQRDIHVNDGIHEQIDFPLRFILAKNDKTPFPWARTCIVAMRPDSGALIVPHEIAEHVPARRAEQVFADCVPLAMPVPVV
jgi:hypothetical protein